MTTEISTIVLSTPVFNFEDHEINPIMDGDEVLFNANEICNALGYVNSRDAVARFVTDVDDVVKRDAIDSMGRNQVANFITESGLYALIFGSEMKEAKKFKRWVTKDVLPSIRKTGFYESPAYLQMKADAERTKLLEAQTKTLQIENKSLVRENYDVKDRNEYLEGKKSLAIDNHELKQMIAAYEEACEALRAYQDEMCSGEWAEGTSKSSARTLQRLAMQRMKAILRIAKNLRKYFEKSHLAGEGSLESFIRGIEREATYLHW